MSILTAVYHCKGPSCGWSGTAMDVARMAGGASCCPTCRAAVTSFAVDLEVEQKALERDRVAVMNTITTKRQALIEAQRAHRHATERRTRAARWLSQVKERYRDNSPQHYAAIEELLCAQRLEATAKVKLAEAIAAAGVWGQS